MVNVKAPEKMLKLNSDQEATYQNNNKILVEWKKLRTWAIFSIGKDVGKQVFSYTICGNVNWDSLFGWTMKILRMYTFGFSHFFLKKSSHVFLKRTVERSLWHYWV